MKFYYNGIERRKAHSKVLSYKGKYSVDISFPGFKCLVKRYSDSIPKKIKKRLRMKNCRYLFLTKSLFRFVFARMVSECYCKVTKGQLEYLRRVARRFLSKKVYIYKRLFTWLPLYSKPAQARMGKGKGNKFLRFVCPVYPGTVSFDFGAIRFFEILKLEKYLSNKKPFKLKMVIF